MKVQPDSVVQEAWGRFVAGQISEEEAHQMIEQRQERREAGAQGASGRRRRRDPREDRPGPAGGRMYAKEMDCRAMRDPRLTPGARVAVVTLRALAGDRVELATTKARLARLLCVSARTAQRYLSQLRRYGYIRAQAVVSKEKRMTTHQQIRLMAGAVLPFWHPMRRASPKRKQRTKSTGETKMTPRKDSNGIPVNKPDDRCGAKNAAAVVKVATRRQTAPS